MREQRHLGITARRVAHVLDHWVVRGIRTERDGSQSRAYMAFVPGLTADKGMYFIWDFTQLNVRPHSRVGLLKYKTAPIPSFRRRPESRRAHSVIPAQAGIQAGPFRHSGAGRNPGGPIPSFRRRPESKRTHSVIPAQAGIQADPFRHSGAGRNPSGPIPSFRRRPESKRTHSVIPA